MRRGDRVVCEPVRVSRMRKSNKKVEKTIPIVAEPVCVKPRDASKMLRLMTGDVMGKECEVVVLGGC